jgi:CRP-like cAMP-binding protein
MNHHGWTDEHLAQVPLFQGLTRRQLRTVSSLAARVDLGPGKVLAKEGRRGHEFFIVLDGEVDVRHGDQVLETRGPGEYVGEMALMDSRPRTADLVTKTPVTIEVMSSREFQSLLSEVPALSTEIRATMAARRAAEPEGATPVGAAP